MIADPARASAALARYLRTAGRDCASASLTALRDGAGPETWALRIVREDGSAADLVLRTDAATRLSESRSRVEEFAALSAAFAVGVPVPEPVLLEASDAILGAPFFLMRRQAGTARPAGVLAMGGGALLTQCAHALAAIHAILVPDLGDRIDVPSAALDRLRAALGSLENPRPALALGLAWADVHRPPPAPVVLAHRDFRVGNLLVERGKLSAVLDWEFAGPSDREEDLGWFCAPAWRHGRLAREAGGLASLEAWLEAYQGASGHRADPARVRWWSVVGQLRWALIAIEQAGRALGGQPDLDLALTGHRLPEVERDLLDMIAPERWPADASHAGPLFTPDGPSADELEAIAAALPPGTTPHESLRPALHGIAARLRAAGPRDIAHARALAARIAADPQASLGDPLLRGTLRAEAAARATISRREAEPAPVALSA